MPLSKTAKNELEEKKQKVLDVIDKMIKNGERISFYSVASKANCSRTFLYNFESIRQKIEQSRNINPNRPKDNFKSESEREAYNYISIDAYMENYNNVYKLFNKYAIERGMFISGRDSRFDRRVDVIIKGKNDFIYLEIKYLFKVPYYMVWFLGYAKRPTIIDTYLKEKKIEEDNAIGLIYDDLDNLFKILDNKLIDCKLVLKEKEGIQSFKKIEKFEG